MKSSLRPGLNPWKRLGFVCFFSPWCLSLRRLLVSFLFWRTCWISFSRASTSILYDFVGFSGFLHVLNNFTSNGLWAIGQIYCVPDSRIYFKKHGLNTYKRICMVCYLIRQWSNWVLEYFMMCKLLRLD